MLSAPSNTADLPYPSANRDGPTFPALRSKSIMNILYVEDDDADAYLVERILDANPLVGSVLRARDGEQAFHSVGERLFKPDLAIIDLQMPRMDGMTLMRRLQELDYSFPFFVFSSSASTVDMLRAYQCGTSFFVTKANRPEHLAQQINTALRQF